MTASTYRGFVSLTPGVGSLGTITPGRTNRAFECRKTALIIVAIRELTHREITAGESSISALKYTERRRGRLT